MRNNEARIKFAADQITCYAVKAIQEVAETAEIVTGGAARTLRFPLGEDEWMKSA
jgi:hypothetical protein